MVWKPRIRSFCGFLHKKVSNICMVHISKLSYKLDKVACCKIFNDQFQGHMEKCKYIVIKKMVAMKIFGALSVTKTNMLGFSCVAIVSAFHSSNGIHGKSRKNEKKKKKGKKNKWVVESQSFSIMYTVCFRPV